ncbi:MAG: septum site-determining protein MinC [Firmicutes bacterium]|nr:septum site-determining protein MinC [Bacillota bacterium]
MTDAAKSRQDSSSNSPGIVFKGYKSGLTLIIPETGSFETYLDELRNHLDQAKDFFKGAKLAIKTGNRQLCEEERFFLLQIIEEAGMVVQPTVNEPETSKKVKKKGASPQGMLIPSVTVRKTVRSGQRIEYEGNILVMGDVNPGAEIIAAGDIVVLGKLRGTAHAGANGNRQAEIFAFQIKPVQIRIAEVYTRAPEKERLKDKRYFSPEVAMIRDDRIVVEKVTPNYFNQKYKY